MSVAFRAVPRGFHGVDHAEEPIDGHQNENVDADVRAEIHQRVGYFAQEPREVVRMHDVDVDRVRDAHENEG